MPPTSEITTQMTDTTTIDPETEAFIEDFVNLRGVATSLFASNS